MDNYTNQTQPNMQQPSNYQYNTNYNPNIEDREDTTPLTVGEWILVLLVPCIPCAGLILYIYWAFSKKGNLNRKNYCKASLILMLIGVVIYAILAAVFGAAIFSLVNTANMY